MSQKVLVAGSSGVEIRPGLLVLPGQGNSLAIGLVGSGYPG
jgi:hypothetical protein